MPAQDNGTPLENDTPQEVEIDNRKHSQSVSSNGQAFWQGLLASLPLTLAAIPFAVVYGALGESLALDFWVVMAISIFVFAGASQFIALTMMAANAQLIIIVLTVMLVNLRHTLYAMSLTPLLRNATTWKKVLMGFSLTDETYAVVVNRATQNRNNLPAYYAGSAAIMYCNWLLWSAVGFLVGAEFPQLQSLGLDVAMVVAFTGIIVASINAASHWYCLVAAIISAVLTYHWPYQLGLLFSSLFAIAVGVASQKRITTREKRHD